MAKFIKKNKVYFNELDRADVNPFEVVNVASQATRLINDQIKLGILDLPHKASTEALQKVFDGRVIKLEEEED
ncbi:MAG: hypothetical protein ABIA63_14330 [bacterium]